MPQGLKLDPSFTSVTIGNCIEDAAGIQHLKDALQTQPYPISRWLMDCEAVCALLLAPDGAIRDRNRAACRVFPPDSAKAFGLRIWDYLSCSDVRQLREWLADSGGPSDASLLLNIADEDQNPISLEVALVRCNGAILLLANQENRHDSQFQKEMFQQTNDLTVRTREAARMNRVLKEINEKVEQLARTDALTGLANRRTFLETLEREITRAQRQGGELSIIMADLDRFKSINDQYGHLAGDRVLAGAAAVFASQLRPYDLAARYGGEEFILLVPGTSADDAVAVAERVRKEIAILKVPGCPRQITVSLGVACWMKGETPEQSISRADAALYLAKNSGRNRVEAAVYVRE